MRVVLGLIFLVYTHCVRVGRYDCARTAPFHPSIHNLGNVGPLGSMHARGARVVTSLIDKVAYGGRDMRSEVAEVMKRSHPESLSVLEVGCGVGTLTKHLASRFESVIAVDTSKQMLHVAKQQSVEGVELLEMNGVDVAEHVRASVSISCMMFHELPKCAHKEVLRSMIAASDLEEAWIVDIDTTYTPSFTMLSGEPYLPDYLENIDSTIESVCGELSLELETFPVVEGHVRAWILRPPVRSEASYNKSTAQCK